MTSPETSLSAALEHRYRLLREVGAGGMATVYLARDLRHERDVAIKVLRADVAAELGTARFMREISIAAGLQHPGILAVHDSGEAAGFLYYVMPYVKGDSLRDRMQRGPLALDEALPLITQIADALAHAHGQGVVHRDMKPENVMLSGGHVLVMDFGVAKALTDSRSSENTTAAGMILGTPAYMAPEQVGADPALDQRADIYALGVIAYEMLAGRLPFTVNSSTQMLAAHLTRQPDDLRALRPEVPSNVASAVERALAKDPSARWQSATDFVAGLRGVQSVAATDSLRTVAYPSDRAQRSPKPGLGNKARLALVGTLAVAAVVIGYSLWPTRPDPLPRSHASASATAPSNASIAVLPFVDMSEEKNQGYFSDGLSEELLSQLAQVPKLRVISRTSSFSFKDKAVDVATIARALGVSTVLEGSVRKAGSTVRITARLTRASDSSNLWSHSYDRQLTDVFKVQDEIAASVVSALRLELLPGQLPTGRPRTANADAYDQFLLANQFFNRGTPDGYRQAVPAYQRSVALDAGYAPAFAGLALAEAWAADLASTPAHVDAGRRRARAAADQAVRLSPTLADGYAARGWIRFTFDWDWSGAKSDLERAVELDPGNAQVQRLYGNLLSSIGELPQALQALQRSVQLDPLSSRSWAGFGIRLHAAGRTVEARQALQRALALNPESTLANLYLGGLDLSEGKPADAMVRFSRAGEFRQAGEAMVEYTLGNRLRSDQLLQGLIASDSHDLAYEIAGAYAWRGEKDAAFEWLQTAAKQRDGGLAAILFDPRFETLRDDPRYAGLLRTMGLPASAR